VRCAGLVTVGWAACVLPSCTGTSLCQETRLALCNTIPRVCDEVIGSNHWFDTEISRVEFVALARASAHLLGQTSLKVLADPWQWPLLSSVAASPGRTSARAPAGSVLRWAPRAGRRTSAGPEAKKRKKDQSRRAVFPAALVEAGSEGCPWCGGFMGSCKRLSLLGLGARILLGMG